MILKILQWNIWCNENPEHIAKEIRRINPDIACVQEVCKNNKVTPKIDTAKTISDLIDCRVFYQDSATWDNRSDKTAQGNAIFSRFPFSNPTFIFVQDFYHNPSDATREGRVYLEVEVMVGRKKVAIGTTHLSYSPRFEIANERKKEVENLVEIVKKKKRNFILTGDLNSTPDSYTVRSLLKYLKNAGPGFEEKTWTTKPFDYLGFKEDGLNWRIDYLFTSKDIKVLSAETMDTPYSDHLPILVKIEV